MTERKQAFTQSSRSMFSDRDDNADFEDSRSIFESSSDTRRKPSSQLKQSSFGFPHNLYLN